MKTFEDQPPLLIDHAKGSKLIDQAGNYYYDTIASWWCNIHGHSHPKLNKALSDQAEKMSHIMFGRLTHQPAITCAEKLVNITPDGLNKVFFSDNGSTAVEVALKLCLQYWQFQNNPQKNQFVHLDKGYHGDTIGAMSVSGVRLFRDTFKPLLFESHSLICPETPEAEAKSLEHAQVLFKNNHHQIAGLILEPLVMGAGGMIMYSDHYLGSLYELCKSYNIHFIADEVAVGFGRTGHMFACEKVGICPDYLCLSKGLTSGYLPLAATLTTQPIFDAFYSDDKSKTFFHGHTYAANPLACAVANATMDLFEEENTLFHVRAMSKHLTNELQKLEQLTCVTDIRQTGLIAAFLTPGIDKEEIYKEGLKNHLMLRPMGEVSYLFLPFSVSKDEITEIMDNIKTTLQNLQSK